MNNETNYLSFLAKIKKKIQQAQFRAVISVNEELIFLYWEIGRNILERQNKEGWGSKVIDRLSKDLTKSFPKIKGLLPRNLKYMRKFAEQYPDFAIVQEPLAQLTWYNNITLLEKIDSISERLWYAKQTIKNGWSRNVLVHQIELGVFRRQGKVIHNFANTLPSPQSDLARQTLKDPYVFDFLSLSEKVKEKKIEEELTKNITKFLLELGAGFAFLGKQYLLKVAGQEYFIDLLFYHLILRCYIVVELKTGAFKPEYAGKLNFYLSAIDEELKHKQDNPSIGMILCKRKNRIVAEYSLKNIAKPMGISECKIVRSIPEKLKTNLPTIYELEKELSK